LVETPEKPELPEPAEESAADLVEADEAAVVPPALKPSTPKGGPRKPGEASAKKSELNKDVTESERRPEKGGDKKYQIGAELGGRAPTRAFGMKRDGQDADRYEIGEPDASRRKNRPDDRRPGNDGSRVDTLREHGVEKRTEAESIKTEGIRGTNADVAGKPSRRAGGVGGGGAAGNLPLTSHAFRDGNGVKDGGQLLGRKKLAAAAQSGSAPQIVQVLFVLRTVNPPASVSAGPPAKIAADVPPGQPPTGAQRVRRAEISAEAVEAAEGVVDSAEPPVRD
jgi:hypothetical protein